MRKDGTDGRQKDEGARHQYPEPGSPAPAPFAPLPPGVRICASRTLSQLVAHVRAETRARGCVSPRRSKDRAQSRDWRFATVLDRSASRSFGLRHESREPEHAEETCGTRASGAVGVACDECLEADLGLVPADRDLRIGDGDDRVVQMGEPQRAQSSPERDVVVDRQQSARRRRQAAIAFVSQSVVVAGRRAIAHVPCP